MTCSSSLGGPVGPCGAYQPPGQVTGGPLSSADVHGLIMSVENRSRSWASFGSHLDQPASINVGDFERHPRASRTLADGWRAGRLRAAARSAGSIPAAARDAGRAAGDNVGVEYVSRVPGPPLDGLIDDLYYLEGAPPYSRLLLPAAPAPLLIVNLGAPFLIRAGAGVDAVEYADGCAVTTPTRAWEFSYPTPTRSVGVHFRPWGLAPFLPMPAFELCDRPATMEQIWGQPATAELRHRLTSADTPHEMLMVLEEELARRLRVIDGLDLVRQVSSAVAATGGTVPISHIGVAARASSTYVAKRFRAVVGVTPKRLARSYRFTSTVLAIDVAAPIDWGDVAAGAGYFDQAHFVREFREFTGLTPTRYAEVRRRFLRDHPDHVLAGWPLPAD